MKYFNNLRSEDLRKLFYLSPRLLIVLALLLFNILAVSALDMSQNKVSQWTLDEGATPFADNSTGGLSPLASSGSVTSVKSFQGNGTSFGSNGYLRPSANVARLGANIAGKRTMLMWINITGLPDASDTIYTEYQVNQNLLRFNTGSNYTMTFTPQNGGAVSVDMTPYVNKYVDVWFVTNSTQTLTYVNGTLAGTSVGDNTFSITVIDFGNNGAGGTAGFNGAIDYITIWNDTKTQANITEIRNYILNITSSPSAGQGNVIINSPTNSSSFYVGNHAYVDVNVSNNGFGGNTSTTIFIYNNTNDLLYTYFGQSNPFLQNITSLSVGTYKINATAWNYSNYDFNNNVFVNQTGLFNGVRQFNQSGIIFQRFNSDFNANFINLTAGDIWFNTSKTNFTYLIWYIDRNTYPNKNVGLVGSVFEQIIYSQQNFVSFGIRNSTSVSLATSFGAVYNITTMVTGTFNGINISIYQNDTLKDSDLFNIREGQYVNTVSNNFMIVPLGGLAGNANFSGFDISIFSVKVWNRSLSSSEVASEYILGANAPTTNVDGLVLQYLLNNTAPVYSNSTHVFNVNLTSSRVGGVENFSSTNTFFIYNATSGSILSPLGGFNTSSRYLNISWSNASFNPSGTSQSISYQNLSLLNDDLTLNRSIYNTAIINNNFSNYDLYSQNLSVGSYWLRLQQTDANGNTVTTQNRINITTNTLINVTAKTLSGSSISNFSINAITDNLNVTVSTTRSFAEIDSIRGVINLSIDADGFALSNASTASVSVSTSNYSYQFRLYETNTLNITFYNQATPSVLLTGQLINLDIISNLFANNYSTTNGSMYITLLTPETYTMRYYSSGFTTRFYLVTVSNRSYQELRLYLINLTSAINLTLYVVDELNVPVEDAVVKVLKYDLATNTYILQEIASTDVNGKVIVSVVNNEYYKFIIERDGVVVKITSPAYITSNPMTIQLDSTQDYTSDLNEYAGITSTLDFNTLTNNFRFTYSTTNNLITGFCVYVYQSSNQSLTLVNSSCLSGASGSSLYGVNPVNGTTYKAYSYYYDGTDYVYLRGATYTYPDATALNIFGNYGLFLQILLTLGFASMMFINTSLGLIMVNFSLYLGRYLGLNSYSSGALMGVTIASVGIIIYLMASNKGGRV